MANEHTDLRLFIGGEWEARGSRATRPVINPATGVTLGELPIATQADLDRAPGEWERAGGD